MWNILIIGGVFSTWPSYRVSGAQACVGYLPDLLPCLLNSAESQNTLQWGSFTTRKCDLCPFLFLSFSRVKLSDFFTSDAQLSSCYCAQPPDKVRPRGGAHELHHHWSERAIHRHWVKGATHSEVKLLTSAQSCPNKHFETFTGLKFNYQENWPC